MMERLIAVGYEGDHVLVIHRDPGRYENFIASSTGTGGGNSNKRKPFWIIGRSMFETNKIPTHWIDPCNELVDSIWVPSHFNVETFNLSGVNASKISVVHETFDSRLFDPQRFSSNFPIPQRLSSNFPIHTNKSFKFLSLGKWEVCDILMF